MITVLVKTLWGENAFELTKSLIYKYNIYEKILEWCVHN